MWTIGLQDRELTCWEEVRAVGWGGHLVPGRETTAEPVAAIAGDDASFLRHDGGDCCWGPGWPVARCPAAPVVRHPLGPSTWGFKLLCRCGL